MVKIEYKYAFTRRWLKLNKTVIFNGYHQILSYYGPPVSEPKISMPSIVKDALEFDDTKRKVITDYEELLKNNVVIVARITKTKYYRGQHYGYSLRRRNALSKDVDYGKIPPNHFVEWDRKHNAYRLKGKGAGYFGVGRWHFATSQQHTVPENQCGTELQALRLLESWYPYEITKEIKPTLIRELPVLKSDEDGKIICLPLSQDEPSIAITGQKGGGKTFLLVSILSRAYWYWKRRCIVLNDSLRQSDVLCQRWYPGSSFFKQLAMLNEHSIQLPAVYLNPEEDTAEFGFMEDKKVGFRISLSFKELISEYALFFKNSCWDLGNTTKYLKKYKDGFSKCKDINQIENLIDSLVEDKLIPDTSGPKILAIFNEIFEKNILDISNKIHPLWRVVRKDDEGEIVAIVDYPPLIASIFANLVPVFVTSNLVNKEYFPQYYKYIGKQLFKFHSQDKWFENNKICTWVFIDELTAVASRTNKSLPSEVIKQFVEQGRPLRIGTVYATQSYSELLHGVRQNTNYLFSMREMDMEAKEIKKDFNLSKSQQKELLSLKPREVMAMTKLKFVTYDGEGNRKEEEGPFKGKALPPLNMSSVPKKIEE